MPVPESPDKTRKLESLVADCGHNKLGIINMEWKSQGMQLLQGRNYRKHKRGILGMV